MEPTWPWRIAALLCCSLLLCACALPAPSRPSEPAPPALPEPGDVSPRRPQ